MRYKKNRKIGVASFIVPLFVWFILGSITPAFAQNYELSAGIISYSGVTFATSTDNTVTGTLGQPVTGNMVGSEGTRRGVGLGIWSFFQLPPRAPYVFASDGDYPDRVEIEWYFDPLSPPADQGYKVWRDGSLMATLTNNQPSYQDFNVLAGDYYDFEIAGFNEYGTSNRSADVGFVNPNGTVTGNISTTNNVPVADVEVSLSPNLGQSLDFDGGDDYAGIDGVALDNRSFTIEFWAKRGSLGTHDYAIGQGTWTQPDMALHIGFRDNNKFTFAFYGDDLNTTQVYTDTNWHHWAVTYEVSTKKRAIYRGGVLAAEGTAGNHYSGTGELLIGQTTGNGYGFDGQLDDIRVWSIVREPEDIQRDMNRTLSGTEDGLTAYWKLDEGSSDWLFDQTANDYDGRLYNGPVWSADIAPVTNSGFTDEDGNYIINGIFYGAGTTFQVTPDKIAEIDSYALSFDGIDNYLDVTDSLQLGGDLTIEAWVYPRSYKNWSRIIDFGNGSPNNNIFLALSNGTSGYPQFRIYNRSGSPAVNASQTLPLNTWTHVAATLSGSTGTIYFNGVSVGSGPLDIPAEIIRTNQYIGRSNWISDGYADAIYDEIRIWDVARSQTEIQSSMNVPLDGDEVGLVGYWPLNEGSGQAAVDGTTNNFYAFLHKFADAEWVEGGPVTQEIVHEFSPESRIVTLTPSNTAVDGVDFIDTTLIPVSGYVFFADTECFADSVEIYVDGEPNSPPVYTETDGSFLIEFDPGSSHELSAHYQDFDFTTPNGWPAHEITNISHPVAGLIFEITTQRTLAVNVVGGTCRTPLHPLNPADSIEVILHSTPGCFERIRRYNTATITISNLPPLKYNVFVKHWHPDLIGDQGESIFDGQAVSLRDSSNNLEYLYRTSINTDITVLNLPNNGCPDVVILEQGHSYQVDIAINENYSQFGGAACDIDTGFVSIFDDVGDSFRIRPFSQGAVMDTIVAGSPNLLDGGSHPFQKLYQVVGEDLVGRQASDEQWMYVEGARAREPLFTTYMEGCPDWVLRKPPGDGSSTFWMQDSTYSVTLTDFEIDGDGLTSDNMAYLWDDAYVGVGGMKKAYEVRTGLHAGFELMWYWEDTNSITKTITFSSSFSTSDNPAIVGDGGDVFIGTNYNIIFSEADRVDFSLDNCNVAADFDTILTMEVDSLQTGYVYTDQHIRDTIIPELQGIVDRVRNGEFEGDEPDTNTIQAAITNWGNALARNEILKENALESDMYPWFDNLSFDAGATLEYSYTTSWDSIYTHAEFMEENYGTGVFFELEMPSHYGVEFALSYNRFHTDTWDEDADCFEDQEHPCSIEDTEGEDEHAYSTANTYGFILADDDPGDYFTVDVKQDSLGQPVFDLRAGRSSCPWEPGTQPRDGVQLSVDPMVVVDVPPDEPAVYTLMIGNDSQSEEDRSYHLRVLQETNVNGATVKVNGVTIEDYLEFNVPAGQQLNAVMTIERGPLAYSDTVRVMLYSPCEYELDILDNPEDVAVQFMDIVTVVADFIPNCSNVRITSPGDNWLHTNTTNDTVWVTLAGYDLTSESFAELKLQYRPTEDNREGSRTDVIGENPLSSNKFIRSHKTVESVVLLTPVFDELPTSKPNPIDNASEKANNGGDDLRAGWVTIMTVPRDTLIEYGHALYVRLPWATGDLDDGEYEIRAIASCINDDYPGQSSVRPGLIERRAPAVFGDPQPADGVLNAGDIIQVQFTEPINCSTINPVNDVELMDTVTGTDVFFDYSCYENIIHLTIDLAYNQHYENHTLRATVRGVSDLYGHELGADTPGNTDDDAFSWEFFVDRNPVHWCGGHPDVVKYEDETLTLTRQLANNGAVEKPFTLTGIPNWLTASPLSGQVYPNAPQTITLNFADDLLGGAYLDTIYAHTNMGDEPLIIKVNVVCHPPDWSVDPTDYLYSMNLTGELITNEPPSLHTMVGAFINNQLRGVATVDTVSAVNDTLFFMTIYSNLQTENGVTIRAWDGYECREIGQMANAFNFMANDILGELDNPEEFNISPQIVETLSLSDGWNWFSLNLELADYSLMSALGSLPLTDGDMIKDQCGYSQFVHYISAENPDSTIFEWVGTIEELNNQSTYFLRMALPGDVEWMGMPLSSADNAIIIAPGWNWISYHPSLILPVDVALASLNNVTQSDLIKDQYGFAQYYAATEQWIGSLSDMYPGRGYLMKVTNQDTLTYPQSDPAVTVGINPVFDLATSTNKGRDLRILPDDWMVNPAQFEHNMTLTGMVDSRFHGNSPLDRGPGDDYQAVAAFVEDECRGVAVPVAVPGQDNGLFFLMIYGQFAGEMVEYRAITNTNEIINLTEIMPFEPNAAPGDGNEPFVWTAEVLAIDESETGDIPTKFGLNQNFPNPFIPLSQGRTATTINFAVPIDSDVEITVYNAVGQRVKSLVKGHWSPGYHAVVWNADNDAGDRVKSGVYFYRMTASLFEGDNHFDATRKLLLLK